MFFLLFPAVMSCFCFCVSDPAAKNNAPYAYLTNNSKYFLLPPSGIEKQMDMPQLLSASYGGQDYFFNAWVKADETGIDMTLLNELGAGIGELSYRDGAAAFSSAVFPNSLRPEYIVADFQLCFYNAGAVEKALEDCNLSMESENNVRRIRQGNTVIMEIEKSPDAVRLINYLRGYSYTLEGDFR